MIRTISLSNSPLKDSSQKRNGLESTIWNWMKYSTMNTIQQSSNGARSNSKRKGLQKVNVLEVAMCKTADWTLTLKTSVKTQQLPVYKCGGFLMHLLGMDWVNTEKH